MRNSPQDGVSHDQIGAFVLKYVLLYNLHDSIFRKKTVFWPIFEEKCTWHDKEQGAPLCWKSPNRKTHHKSGSGFPSTKFSCYKCSFAQSVDLWLRPSVCLSIHPSIKRSRVHPSVWFLWRAYNKSFFPFQHALNTELEPSVELLDLDTQDNEKNPLVDNGGVGTGPSLWTRKS